jgi:hypothetical protein
MEQHYFALSEFKLIEGSSEKVNKLTNTNAGKQLAYASTDV